MGDALNRGPRREEPPDRSPRSTRRRNLVIETAAGLFQQSGYRRTSMNDIAAELGFTKAALYYYFDSKGALLEAIALSIGAELRDGIPPPDEESPSIRLRHFAEHHVSVIADRRALFSVSMLERAELGEGGRARVTEGERQYLQQVMEIISRLPPRPPDVPDGQLVAAHALVAMLNSPAEWYRPGRLTPTEVAATLVDVFRNGIGRPGAASAVTASDPRTSQPAPIPAPVNPAPVDMAAEGKSRRGRWDDLLSVSLDVFHERGYHSTTLQHLADALGVTKPALYYYVDSKADLLDAVVTRSLDPLVETLKWSAATTDDGWERLRLQVRLTVQHLHRERVAFWVFLHSGAYVDDRVGQRIADASRRFVALLQETFDAGREQGVFRDDIDPVVLSRALAGMLKATVRWFRPSRAFSPATLAELLCQLTLHGCCEPEDRVIDLSDRRPTSTVTLGRPDVGWQP
ncbi:MAG: hypothetical protein QOD57_4289 [Actinomycetota bacterium]|jgi:AcrR family transcriptional regulator|nr:hypothetical protein [Actinomycetota bacterium]